MQSETLLLEESQNEFVAEDLVDVLSELTLREPGQYEASVGGPGRKMSDQEREVEDVLEQYGFSEVPALKGSGNSDLSKYQNLMAPRQFVYNPRGSQKSPDFLIRDVDGLFYALECKSCKNGKIGSIQWNSGIPESNFIYLIDDNRNRFLSMGHDLITEEERCALITLREQLSVIATSAEPTLGRWKFYMRPMHNIKCELPKTIEELTDTVMSTIVEKVIKLWD